MNKNLVKILVLFLVTGAMVIIAWEFISERKERGTGNPWEYNVDEFMLTQDSSLVKFTETLNIQLDTFTLHGIACHENKLYIIGRDFLQVITTDGKELLRKELNGTPRAVDVSGTSVFIAFPGYIESFDLMGERIHSWSVTGNNPLITSIAVYEDNVFIADAANRKVLRYNTNGEYIGEFEGKSEADQAHGFIVPSACFDLDVSNDGELWVVNPGKHALEHYTYEGRLIRFWQKSSFGPEGFSGCCNPVHIAVMPDGSFITSEKGIIRIKIHKPYGDLYGFVAAPEKFPDAIYAPDVILGDDGIVYALDFNTNRVRVFEHN